MAQATPSTGVCPGPRRGGGESSPFCGAKGGRGAQRRRGFIRPKHRRTCSQSPPSLSLQRRGHGSEATAGDTPHPAIHTNFFQQPTRQNHHAKIKRDCHHRVCEDRFDQMPSASSILLKCPVFQAIPSELRPSLCRTRSAKSVNPTLTLCVP